MISRRTVKACRGVAVPLVSVFWFGWLLCFWAMAPPGLLAGETVTNEDLFEQVSKVQTGQMDQQTLSNKIVGRRAEIVGVVQEVRDDGPNLIVLTGQDLDRHFTSCMLKLDDKQAASGVMVGQTINFTGTIDGFFLGRVLISDVRLEEAKPNPENDESPPPSKPVQENTVEARMSPEEVIKLFYSASSATDVSLAINQWVPAKRTKSLIRMIENIEWFQVEQFVPRNTHSNYCTYNMTATGQSRGESTITWNLDVTFVLYNGEWKIESWSNIRKIGG